MVSQFQRFVLPISNYARLSLINLAQVFIAGIVVGHVACKYVYVRVLRGSAHMHKRSFVGIGTWIGIGGLLWIIAWIIAESIPGFNDLLSFVVCLSSVRIVYAANLLKECTVWKYL
jgi:hypothetical protein